jgi:sugar/nucleoside kinase (ribokinase family)
VPEGAGTDGSVPRGSEPNGAVPGEPAVNEPVPNGPAWIGPAWNGPVWNGDAPHGHAPDAAGDGGRTGLLVIGDVVTDIVARPEHALAPGTDTAAAIEVRPGGSGANTAAWAAHHGARVRMFGRAGGDGDAAWHRDALAHAGVEPRLLATPGHPTARLIALVDPAGERTMVTDRGASARLSPQDWDGALLDGAGMLHLSGYTLFTDGGRLLAAAALEAARRAGVPASLDPGSSGFLRGLGVERFLEATRGCTLVLPNEDEAALLTGESDPHAAAVRLSGWYGSAVVTLGARGAVCAVDGGTATACPGRPVAAVTDAIGAGDAFAGALLAATLAGAALPDAVDAGCRAGALAVTLPGGRPPAAAPGRSGARTPAGRPAPADRRAVRTSSPDG